MSDVPPAPDRSAERRRRAAEVVSEIGGPAPLLVVGMLEVGLAHGALLATVLLAFAVGIVPYAVTVWFARAGRLSGRFVADRRQRAPIMLATLLLAIGGTALVAALGGPRPLVLLGATAVVGIIVATAVTAWWKISIHATIAAFFAALQVVLYGPIGFVAVVIPIAVAWARLQLRAHTAGQLVAGTALGVALAVGYGVAAVF